MIRDTVKVPESLKNRPTEIHVVQINLKVNQAELKKIQRLAKDQAKIKNATLGTMLKRIDQLKRLREWKALRAGLYHSKRGTIDYSKLTQKEKQDKYSELKADYRVSPSEAVLVAQHHWRSSKSLPDHVDGRMATQIGKEVWVQVSQYLYCKKGRPQFQPSKNRTLIAGNDNISGLHYSAGKNNQPGRVLQTTKRINQSKHKPLGNKYLNLKTDWSNMPKPRRDYYLTHQQTIKKMDLVIHKNGQIKAHLFFECLKYRSGNYLATVNSNAICTFDLNTSELAWTSKHPLKGYQSGKIHFEQGTGVSPEDMYVPPGEKPYEILVQRLNRIIRKRNLLHKAIQRSAQVTNPQCYDSEGRPIKGKRHTSVSNKQRGRLNQLNNLYKEESNIKEQLRQIEKRFILSKGDRIGTEADNPKNWGMTGHGKRIQAYTHGAKRNLILTEANTLGGKSIELNTYKGAFSQRCLCGLKVKKTLSNRTHSCKNKQCKLHGYSLDRDLFASFLMLLVLTNKEGHTKLLNKKLLKHWTVARDCCSLGYKVVDKQPDKAGSNQHPILEPRNYEELDNSNGLSHECEIKNDLPITTQSNLVYRTDDSISLNEFKDPAA